MDGGGDLVPLSYIYGYRGGLGRRGVGQDTTGDDVIEIRAQNGRYELRSMPLRGGFRAEIGHVHDGPCGSTEKRPI